MILNNPTKQTNRNTLHCLLQSNVISPRVSLLIRVKDEIAALPLFWERLQSQTIYSATEVIFLDSGSNDGTVEFLLEKQCSVYRLDGEFNFGRSCNQIASLSNAPILVFLSGHVLLEADDALEQAVTLLERSPNGAAYFRQIPNSHLGYNAYEAAFLSRRFSAGDKTVRMHVPGAFSNAASAITRASWERQPFQEVHGSEDFLWAKDHLARGGELFYMPQVRVLHSHNETSHTIHHRVRINAMARGQTHAYGKAIYMMMGVYVSMLRAGAGHREAVEFAWAHGSAYF